MNFPTTTAPSITCGNCHKTHHSVAAVRGCYSLTQPSFIDQVHARHDAEHVAPWATEQATSQPVNQPVNQPASATEKQVAFIAKLREERGLPEIAFRGDKAQASAEIDRLIALPKADKKVEPSWETPRAITEGIWRVENKGSGYSEDIYKVYRTVHGANILAVKVLVSRAGKKGNFKYLGSATRCLPKSAVKMTADEAANFGKLYGFCVRCGRTLTDENSIAAGIGPVCAGKDYWG